MSWYELEKKIGGKWYVLSTYYEKTGKNDAQQMAWAKEIAEEMRGYGNYARIVETKTKIIVYVRKR